MNYVIIVGGIGNTATKIGNNPPAQSSGPSYSQVVQKPEVSESAGILEKVAFLWWWSNIKQDFVHQNLNSFHWYKYLFYFVVINGLEWRS